MKNFLGWILTRREEPTVAKSRPGFEIVNKLQPAWWLFVGFFVLQ